MSKYSKKYANKIRETAINDRRKYEESVMN